MNILLLGKPIVKVVVLWDSEMQTYFASQTSVMCFANLTGETKAAHFSNNIFLQCFHL